jgi:predicted flap endonuclease-1-like 5' DNA nuclease
MRFYKSLVSSLLLASFALLPGCGAAPTMLPAGATKATTVSAMSAYPIEDIQGVGPVYGKKLRKLGITNHQAFAEATGTVEQVQQLATQLGVPFKVVQGWAAQVALMEVKGIGPRAAALLDAIDVHTLDELATADPAALAEKVGIANAFEPRFLDNTPGLTTVTAWVAQAKEIVAQREADKKAGALQAVYGLNALYVKKLNDGGVADAETLKVALATKKGREKLSKASGLPYPWLQTLAGKVQLMTIEGIGLGEANLLAAVGVTSVKKLAGVIPSDLRYRIGLANASEPRFVEKTPTLEAVTAWVAAAQKLAPSVDER